MKLSAAIYNQIAFVKELAKRELERNPMDNFMGMPKKYSKQSYIAKLFNLRADDYINIDDIMLILGVKPTGP